LDWMTPKGGLVDVACGRFDAGVARRRRDQFTGLQVTSGWTGRRSFSSSPDDVARQPVL
jgi:hypothetical protein